MKKLLIAVVLCFLLIAAVASTALADNGPHGGFSSSNYEKCAGCHRAHSAQSSNGLQLIAADVYELCMACHKDGAGAYTDVANGIYHGSNIASLNTPTTSDLPVAGLNALGVQGDPGAPLFGGGFEKTQAVHTWNGKIGYARGDSAPASGVATTSTHSVAGLGGGNGYGTVWGSGDVVTSSVANAKLGDSWASATTALECTSCHDPHGKAGLFENNTNLTPTTASWSSNATTQSSSTYAASYAVYGGSLTGTKMASYRLLRFTAAGSDGFEATGGTAVLAGYTAGQLWWRTGNTQTYSGITVRESLGFRTGASTYQNPYWYTPNTDYTKDNSVQVYRSRFDSTNGVWTAWEPYVSQPGDAAGRTFSYNRPALTDYVKTTGAAYTTPYLSITSSKVGTVYTCNSDGTTGTGGTSSATLPDYTLFNTTTRAASAFVAGTQYYACDKIDGTGTVSTATQVDVLSTGRFDNSTQRTQVSFFCAECHDRYLAASFTPSDYTTGLNSRYTASDDKYYTYKHSAGGTVSCVDCHYAHGTSAVMTKTNTAYTDASLVTGGSAASTDSALLKLDERSMCAKCHGNDINFSFATNTAP